MGRKLLAAGLLAFVAAACLIVHTAQPSTTALTQERLYIVPQANVLTGIGQRPGAANPVEPTVAAPQGKAPHADRARQQSLYIVPQVPGRALVSA